MGIVNGGCFNVVKLKALESLQFDLQDGGLQSVQPGIAPQTHVVVLFRAFAMNGQRTDQRGQLVVIRENRAAVAVAAQRLGREKAGDGRIAEAARHFAVQTAAKRLRAVFQKQQIVFLGNGFDAVKIGREAENIHRHNSFGFQLALFLYGLNAALQTVGIHVEGVLPHVHENGRGPFAGGALGGRKEREVRYEHRVSRADAPGVKDQTQRVGAVGAGNTMLRSGVLGQTFLQRLDLRPGNIMRILQYPGNGGVHLRLEPFILTVQIPKLHEKPPPYSTSTLSPKALCLRITFLVSKTALAFFCTMA